MLYTRDVWTLACYIHAIWHGQVRLIGIQFPYLVFSYYVSANAAIMWECEIKFTQTGQKVSQAICAKFWWSYTDLQQNFVLRQKKKKKKKRYEPGVTYSGAMGTNATNPIRTIIIRLSRLQSKSERKNIAPPVFMLLRFHNLSPMRKLISDPPPIVRDILFSDSGCLERRN